MSRIQPVALAPETAIRIVRQTRRGEAAPAQSMLREHPIAPLPRVYRAFELTEGLAASSEDELARAEVKWLAWDFTKGEYTDSGETGEVVDTLGACWGVEADRGVAALRGVKDAAPIWEIVQNPGKPRLFGKLDGDLAAGSSATMSIWGGSTLADSGRNITVHDWFLPTGKKLASGAKVAAFWASGKWYVDTTNTCPT